MFKNVVGLIVEYNPFHNGHLHHIQEIDRLFEDNIKIAVMSGDFVQRGEPSLINKFEKTKIALSQGIDIVIELPAFYSTQSAEIFAKGSVNLLNKLSCSHIVFGSESNDLEKLKKIATVSLTKEFELMLNLPLLHELLLVGVEQYLTNHLRPYQLQLHFQKPYLMKN